MKVLDIITTASSNMGKNKARTILTIIAVFIGAFTISLTNGIGSGVKSYLGKQIGNLGAVNTIRIEVAPPQQAQGQESDAPQKYDPNQRLANEADMMTGNRQVAITEDDINKIKSDDRIQSVKHQRSLRLDYVQAAGEKYKVTIMEQFGDANQDMISGRSVSNNNTSREITLPSNYVKALGFSSSQEALGKEVKIGVTNELGEQSEIISRIVGIQQKTFLGSSTAYANSTLADQLYDVQSEGRVRSGNIATPIVVATLADNLSPADQKHVKDGLKEKGFKATTIEDESKSALSTIDAVMIVFAIFGGIALLAASFGIVNTLLMSVQERTKEIGLMKALGSSPRSIFTLFSIEAILIGFWGSALGVLVAQLLGKAVNSFASKGFLKDFPGLELLSFPAKWVIATILGIMLVAFLAGTLPAIRASRKDPIEALRHD